jgi:hypothetical protein
MGQWLREAESRACRTYQAQVKTATVGRHREFKDAVTTPRNYPHLQLLSLGKSKIINGKRA